MHSRFGNIEVHSGASESVEFGVNQSREVVTGYALRFGSNGNLEVRNPLDRVVWESGTADRGASKLALQPDGNLVIYEGKGRPLWATNTDGNRGAFLAVEDDGNIVIYSADKRPIWATQTARA